MNKTTISKGVVHDVPTDMEAKITATPASYSVWEDITPLARNEWICWVTSAVKEETRIKRIRIMCENLAKGKRRPCCWAGCVHR